MASGLAIVVLELLLFAVSGQLQYVEGSRVGKGSTNSIQTVEHAGLTGRLIHRDQYFADEDNKLTHREKRERDARRSRSRAQYLMSKRRLAGTTATTQAEGDAEWETPLSDIQQGSYLMEFSLGTPAQTFLAIADTGSDLTWLECANPSCQTCTEEQCQPCSNGAFFQPTDSSTYSELPCDSNACQFLIDNNQGGCENGNSCEYGYGYGDGSVTQGTLAQDTVTMQNVEGGNQSLPNFSFGCSTHSDSNTSWLQVANGLVGLGRGVISFPSQLGDDFGQKFGYCLVSSYLSTTTAYSSPLFFGSDSVPSTGSQLQYTPINTNAYPTYYDVTGTGISLNGGTISSTGGDFIFDSGTTYTLLEEEIFDALSTALEQQITTYSVYSPPDSFFSLCYSAGWVQWQSDYGVGVPKIAFQFAGTSGFDLLAHTAWIEYDAEHVCLAIMPMQSNLNIFGGYQQVDSHVVYDIGNSQIGFTQGPCNGTNTNKLLPPPATLPPPAPPTSPAPPLPPGVGTSLVTGLLLPLSLLLLLVFQTQIL